MGKTTEVGAKGAEKAKIEKVGKAIVYFRPLDSYNGEFGFDWLREGKGLDNEPDYESIIESGYKDGNSDYTKEEAYKALINEYEKTSIWGFKDPYYIPYLNLFPKTYSDTITTDPKPPYEATLYVNVEIKDADVDEIKFEFNSDIFFINDGKEYSLPYNSVCSFCTTIKITCKKDITTDAEGEILVYTYPKGSKSKSKAEQAFIRNLAGKLIVCKNDVMNRKEAKFVFVRVITQFDNNIINRRKGTFNTNEKKNFYNTLYQSLIVPTIAEQRKTGILGTLLNLFTDNDNDIELDLSTNSCFKEENNIYVNNGNLKSNYDIHSDYYGMSFGGPCNLNKYLRECFFDFTKYPDNKKFEKYFPVFVFEENAINQNIEGQIEAGSNGEFQKCLVLFFANGRDAYTLNHESLHGFKLRHTHRESNEIFIKAKEKKYVYPHASVDLVNSTDNVMSYREIAYTTWHWQWQIIRENL